ncbi:DUF411 domain-containing protein [Methylobacter luteus]|uniref:DUF411 domain-containing protein n=1 Tax=Methylobacter luteus TaxID=415 RepID=UPI0003FFE0EC|nr:DUF411 domain-containing protein [Methylobacter luteus]
MKLLNIFLAIGLLTVNAGVKAENIESAKPVDIVVYRSPSCSCCGKWLEHLKKNNFNVKDVVNDEAQAIKDKYGVPNEMASCHTALVDGYVIEGHVPANDINTLLKMKPKVTGIAVPGMPAGTPGMEMGGRKDPYQVVSFDSEKHYQVFNSYESK